MGQKGPILYEAFKGKRGKGVGCPMDSDIDIIV
jgi:hypothetical protein